MRKEQIKPWLRVIDSRNTPGVIYTWIPGGEFIDGTLYQHVCESCDFTDQYMLREEQIVRGKQLILCTDCAGIDDLEPLAQALN